MKERARMFVYLGIAAAFGAFVAASFLFDVPAGRSMGGTFAAVSLDMLALLPCAFVLIALFDVWVKRETIERHLGRDGSAIGYLWALLLGGMSIGGMIVAFPVAYSLFRKGARLGIVFAYVGFVGVCRIPMTMFEISFMGPLFTAARLAVTIPLVLLSGILMGRFLERRGYAITE